MKETGDEQRIHRLGYFMFTQASERGDKKTQEHELSGMARMQKKTKEIE